MNAKLHFKYVIEKNWKKMLKAIQLFQSKEPGALAVL